MHLSNKIQSRQRPSSNKKYRLDGQVYMYQIWCCRPYFDLYNGQWSRNSFLDREFHTSSLSSPSVNFLTVSCQIIQQLICFVLWVSRCFLLTLILYWHFLYCFGFNLKKKSCRKSKYLQSTVEYLTEYLTIHIWQSRKTLLWTQMITNCFSAKPQNSLWTIVIIHCTHNHYSGHITWKDYLKNL